MKVREFIRLLRQHDTEAEVYCRDGSGRAVRAGFGVVIYPSMAVFMVAPLIDVLEADRDFERKLGKLGRKKIARERP